MDEIMYKTDQEKFWAGGFGDEYIGRNTGECRLAAKTNLFSKILRRTTNVTTAIEYGANIGLNIIAMKRLLPNLITTTVEINKEACKVLERISDNSVINCSLLGFSPDARFDFVLVKTVLIHINPDCLGQVYELLYRTSDRYICIVEYYNPTPTTLQYRGHSDRLFKRDFAGEMMEKYLDLRLIDYGFVYKRDPNFPLDDVSWFLLEKK
jgi:spore coat polysaccharide biosynthesis protein SpsF